MRAREFITEQRDLEPEESGPMQWTYVLPGLNASDPYQTYRFGVAMARDRSDRGLKDGVNDFKPAWSAETAFGQHGVVAGFTQDIESVIDSALAMTKTPGGKKMVSSGPSEEPTSVSTASPIQAFKGYPR